MFSRVERVVKVVPKVQKKRKFYGFPAGSKFNGGHWEKGRVQTVNVNLNMNMSVQQEQRQYSGNGNGGGGAGG